MNIVDTINRIMNLKLKNEDLSIIDIILDEVDEEELDEFLEGIQNYNFKTFREYIKRDAIDHKFVQNYKMKKNPFDDLF